MTSARAKQFAEEIADKADECCERHGEWAKSIYHFALERILSHAAERERLLADADWLIDNIVTQLREMYIASPIGPVTDAAMERHRVRSSPATEGKGDD